MNGTFNEILDHLLGLHYAIYKTFCCLVLKQVLLQNLSFKNEVDLHEEEPRAVGEPHIFIYTRQLNLEMGYCSHLSLRIIPAFLPEKAPETATRNTG